MGHKIYLCTADDDFREEQRLRDGLKPVLEHLSLSLWGRRDIIGGTKWEEEIKTHLAQSQYFVVLVTSNCLASDRCKKEIGMALYRAERNRGLEIIAILARASMFEYSNIAGYPVLPKDGKPIANHANTDQIWTDVLRDLIEAISATHHYIA